MPFNTARRILSADERATKQIERSRAAGDAWLKGTLNPSKNPLTEAKRSVRKWEAGVQAAVANKSFGRGLDRVNEEEMIGSITAAGAGAFSSGVAKAEPKIRRIAGEMQAGLESHVAQMDSLPTDTPEQREQKMLANLRGMRKLKRV
jgi:hypothetical protein